jgi:hypothetical protein
VSEDLKAFIVDDLAEQQPRSDTILAVCERSGMDWPHAEALVNEVESERAHAIAARQAPFLIFLSACIAAGGVLFVAYTIQLMAPLLHGDALHVFLVLVAAIDGPLVFGLIGLCMLAGGVIGVYRTALRYFET